MKAIVFDVDGVLVDSLGPHVQFCHEMNKKYKLNLVLPNPKEGKLIASTPMDNLLRKASFPEKLIPEILLIYMKEFSSKYSPKPFEGINEMILDLKSRGFALAISTANYKANIVQALDKCIDHFDAIYDVENSKSKTDAINHFVKKFKLDPSEVVFVGDSLSDMKSSVQAGVNFIGVTYGWEIEKTNEFYTVDSVKNLKKALIENKK